MARTPLRGFKELIIGLELFDLIIYIMGLRGPSFMEYNGFDFMIFVISGIVACIYLCSVTPM